MHLTSFDMGPGTTSFKGGSEELALGGRVWGRSSEDGWPIRLEQKLGSGVVAELLLFLANR